MTGGDGEANRLDQGTTAGRAHRHWPVWAWPVAVLVLAFVLRTHHLDVPLVDTSDWRQTDTATIAYFYYHLGIQLLHPQLWHDGPGPDYTQLELQITPAIVALLAHIFGFGRVLLHVVAAAFFSLAVLPLWDLTRRHLGTGAANWTVLVYALLPLGIYFGRVFQPEPAQVCFGVLALWTVDRYAARRTLWWYLGAVVAASVAVLAKLPNGMILPAVAAFAVAPDLWRWRAMLRPRRLAEVCGLVLIPVLISAGYTLLQARLTPSGSHYVNFIVTSLGSNYIAGTDNLLRYAWRDVGGMAVTPAGLAAAIIGAAAIGRRRGMTWLWAWGLGIAVYAVVVLRAIRFQYYVMPVLPWLSILMGTGLDFLASRAPQLLRGRLRLAPQMAAVCLIGSLMTGGLFQIRGFWTPYMVWYRQGIALDHTLPKGATVILSGTYNPTLLYYARRHGYRVDLLTFPALQEDIAGGASYLLATGGIIPCMRTYLNSTFPKRNIAGLTVYTLPSTPPIKPRSFCSSG